MAARVLQKSSQVTVREDNLIQLISHASELPPYYLITINAAKLTKKLKGILAKHELIYSENDGILHVTTPSNIPLYNQAIWCFICAIEIYFSCNENDICIQLQVPLADYLSSGSGIKKEKDPSLNRLIANQRFLADRSLFIFLERANLAIELNLHEGLNHLSLEQLCYLMARLSELGASGEKKKNVI